MDVLVEFLLSLILEGSIELARSKKVCKAVRYPLIAFLSLLLLALLGGTPALGVYLIAVTGGSFGVSMGVVLILLSILMIFLFVRKVRRYLRSRRELSFVALDGADDAAVNDLAAMAEGIWHEHYDPILGSRQVAYMVERFQSAAAIKEQISHGYHYRFAVTAGRRVGFFAYCFRDDILYLSKLYLLKEERGKKYSRSIIAYLIGEARAAELPAIELNVNKRNDASIAAYEKLGFKRLRAEKNDIGEGYFMDDFVYRLDIDEGGEM